MEFLAKAAHLAILLTCLLRTADGYAYPNQARGGTSNSGPTPPYDTWAVRIAHPGSASLPLSVVPPGVTILTSQSLPSNPSYLPEVGNGHIATVVQSDTIFMNGLYNGNASESHRARIPSTVGYTIEGVLPTGLTRSYALDLGRGIFTETLLGSEANITLRTYAHRLYTSAFVTELTLSRSNNSTEVGALVHLNSGDASEDIEFTDLGNGVIHGKTLTEEFPEIAGSTEFYMKVSPSLQGVVRMSPGLLAESILSVTVIDVSKERVIAEYDQVLQAFGDGRLLSSHVDEWNKLWSNGRIDVQGDINLAKLNYASLYYILSSLPSHGSRPDWPFVGLSPGGLAHGSNSTDFSGHVLWDQEVWMFPPIALLYPELGRLLVGTRTRTLSLAREYAQATGWQGARYPWESAFTGQETCPSQVHREYAVHINGDVSLMIRQYWQLTRDREFMINGSGAEAVYETAKYWCSRATYDSSSDVYRILGVLPPDEWHYPVNDSVYTNSIAAINLNFASDLARELGQAENRTCKNVGEKLYIPYDPVLGYHPEFDGFNNIHEDVEQADAILLGYPLMVPMDNKTRLSDLTIYQKLTQHDLVPTTTWAMFLIGWLELGDEHTAATTLIRSIQNVQQPFLVWSENADGSGATNFISGMGGYLQSILFGYGGVRLHDENLTFDPKLIPGTIVVKFTGINYRGCSFDMDYSADLMTLTLTTIEPGRRSLDILFEGNHNWQEMIVGQSIETRRQGFTVRSSQ